MHIAVIGGGASGILAAIAAKNENNRVTVYEKEKRIGRKILATGNGRCNMTNINADIFNCFRKWEFYGRKRRGGRCIHIRIRHHLSLIY